MDTDAQVGGWWILLPGSAEWVPANPALAARWTELTGYPMHVRLA